MSPRDAALHHAEERGFSYLACLRSAPPEDIGFIDALMHGAVRSASEALRDDGVSLRRVASALAQVNPYDMPGVSYWFAAARARLGSGAVIKPNSAANMAHLVFAPYVDLFFGDDEAVKNVGQERKSKKRGHLLSQHLPVRIRWAPTPEMIIGEIEELARERETRGGDPDSPS